MAISLCRPSSPCRARRIKPSRSELRTNFDHGTSLDCCQSRDSEFPKMRGCKKRAAPARQSRRRLPPCFAEWRSSDCVRRSASESCDPSARRFRSARRPRSASSSRGPSAGSGRKSPSAMRREKSFSRSMRAANMREKPSEIMPPSSRITSEASEKPFAKFRQRGIDLRERQRHADHHRWAARAAGSAPRDRPDRDPGLRCGGPIRPSPVAKAC